MLSQQEAAGDGSTPGSTAPGSTGPQPNTPPPETPLQLATSAPLAFLISDLKIYDQPLAANQIGQIYKAGFGTMASLYQQQQEAAGTTGSRGSRDQAGGADSSGMPVVPISKPLASSQPSSGAGAGADAGAGAGGFSAAEGPSNESAAPVSSGTAAAGGQQGVDGECGPSSELRGLP